ncbi:MAG TPA: hypothetical protein VGL89_07605 [Candidatus Koribacter sp.]|jgi:glutamate dehydrogenase (NAD(P)+)
MLATEVFSDIERDAQWERAAQLLDISPQFSRKLRVPEFECVSHHALPGNQAEADPLLYIALNTGVFPTNIASVLVHGNLTPHLIAQAAQDLQLEIALADLNCGSAAIGLKVRPAELKERELWQLSRDCSPLVSSVLGPTRLLPVDISSTACAIWLANNTYARASLVMPVLSPELYCAQLWASRAEAAAYLGGLALQEISKKLASATAIVLGSAPFALSSMRRLHDLGCRIVAVADESGAVINQNGLDVSVLLEHVKANGLLAEFADAEHATHAEALNCPADILVITSQGEINDANAAKVSAPIVVEGIAGALSQNVCAALDSRNITVIPASLSRCVPLLSESSATHLSSDERESFINSRLAELWVELGIMRKRYGVPLRAATLLVALQRLAHREFLLHP